MNDKTRLFLLIAMIGLSSCAVRPKNDFDAAKVPPIPDYSSLNNWAAHPDKTDPADLTPSPDFPDLQKDAPVDVIFLYPTSYTGGLRHSSHQRDWNASVSDAKTNLKTDNGTIQYQASLFNGAGRVFAPRYRQAHLHAFFTEKDSASARHALDLAYTDTKAAFEHYLKYWNNGRPFIIAGHSQGARHAMYLIRDLIEGKSVETQLVAAYIVGWPVKTDFYKTFKACETPQQTDCFCSWRTWERKYGLRHAFEQDIVCTNPLIWTTTENAYAAKSLNKGGVITPFEKIFPEVTDAEVYHGILLARKPKFKGSILFQRKNYHIGDLNLYYINVRINAQNRVKAFLRR
ncbi:MAG: DUF3089 domain-containing protein [Saprospiraceae bacterium]|nr:DUF3089 domain-containing protein [Saprospiraceae bacterium]